MIDWNLASTIIVAGLILVVVNLIVLLPIARRLGEGRSAAPVPVAVPAPAPAIAAAPAAVAMGGDDEIAAISAAIACYMDAAAPGVSYAIQSVRRAVSGERRAASGERPVWGFAGMLHNTRPF